MGTGTPASQTSSSNSSSNSNTNSTSTTGANPYIAPYLEGDAANIHSAFAANGPPAYPSNTVVTDPMQTQGTKNLFDVGLAGPQGYADAVARLQGIAGGSGLNIADNPYLQALISKGNQIQDQQFANTVLPSINGTFEAAGRGPNNGANPSAVAQAVSSLGQTQSAANAALMNSAYGQALQQQTAALGIEPSFWASPLTYANAASQAGQAATADAQRYADANTAAYWYGKMAVPDWSLMESQLLQSTVPGGQTTGNSSTNTSGSSYGVQTGTPSSNPTSSFLGAGLGGAGLALQAAALPAGAIPFLGLSDARAKDVHSRVGFTDDGMPLYLYNYKGSQEPRIGPMAQDVAQVKPDAVSRHPSGYLMVDYARAMPPGGLM